MVIPACMKPSEQSVNPELHIMFLVYGSTVLGFIGFESEVFYLNLVLPILILATYEPILQFYNFNILYRPLQIYIY